MCRNRQVDGQNASIRMVQGRSQDLVNNNQDTIRLANMHIHIDTSLHFVYLLNNLNNIRIPNPIPKILLLCDGFRVGISKI